MSALPSREDRVLSYRIAGCALAALAAFAAHPASAQDGEPTRYRVTLGAQVKPQHPGAGEVNVLPYVDVDIAKGASQFKFEAPDDSFGFNLVSGAFEFGPAVSMVSPRKAKDVGVAVPKVARTFEVGAYANAWLGEGFRLHSEVRKAVNGHDGWVADGGADLVLRDGDNWLFSIGPRVTWADGKYHDAYYGVTPASALATGLPIYDPGSGIESWGAAASADFAITPRWGVALYGKYDRLTGDAARSPIVRTYGSRNQYSAGVGISYTFGG